MKHFLAILFITMGMSVVVPAQEHTKRPPAASTPTAPASTTAPDVNTDESGWVRFKSDTGRFSVLMPEIPKDQVETTQSEHGPYTTHLYITRHANIVYLIGWVDYDPSFNFNKLSELNANRDNFVKGIKATLLTSNTKTIDGYQALEFSAETAERTFKSRVYMVGRRPYQIVIGYPKDEEDPVTVNRFFNSFKVRQF
ncbi:MAG TPA: hypothetical protein VFS77_07690 [Pyrinomonadaceae bacterium]|nr:hypothetical protein [Pyrinomonadaceae bacterium]